MAKQVWKAGNMVYPLPAVMVSTADKEGNTNIFTVAWTGTVCTNPAMVYISVRPERYSYHMIEESGEFVINLTTEQLAHASLNVVSMDKGIGVGFKVLTAIKSLLCCAAKCTSPIFPYVIDSLEPDISAVVSEASRY